MVVTYSQIIDTTKSVRKAKQAILNGDYEKVSYGLYRVLGSSYSDIEIIFARYKNIVLTMQSAFEYYDLTDKNYEKYTVAFPSGSRIVKDNRLEQSFLNIDTFYLGRIQVDYHGSTIYIYDKERMLIELIRHRNKLPYDYYKEIVNSYRKLVKEGKINFPLIMKYLKHFKNGERILERMLEVVV